MIFEVSRRRLLLAVAASYVPRAPGESPETPSGREKGIIDLTNSPYAKMRAVPIRAVKISDGFWGKRMKVNREASIPFTHRQMEDHGRFDNFLRWDGKNQSFRAGFHTNHPSDLRAGGDSETYKWIEAASFALDSQHDPDLRKRVDDVARGVIGAQEPSGYLNTYFVEGRVAERMLPIRQFDGHELYNGGHLLMAGMTYQRATGDQNLLDAGLRYINDFILPNYGPEPNQKPLVSGHPGAEMALVELYRTTGDKRHLKLAAYILEGDARIPLERGGSVLAKRDLAFNSSFMFSGIPFISRTKLAGHAVRCLYACCGAADYYLETGDPAYKKALETLWQDLVGQKMYITGGVGVPRAEVFGESYELPNLTAYGESCASIANMMWNWRLLCATGEGRFADVLERALYNGVNSGTSLDGKLYNYCNPLAIDPSAPANIRKPWYGVNCCPPNLERTFASIPGYFYSTAKDGIYVHLFDNSEVDWRPEDGTSLKLTQKTGYPWSGDVELTVMPAQPAEFTVYVRIPGWSRTTKVQVNGAVVAVVKCGEYLPIRRRWSGRDRITLQFDMTPRITAANPRVESDTRRIAVERGPLVYCMEQIDQPETAPLDGFSIGLNENTNQQIAAAYDSNLLDGIVVLRAPGLYAGGDSGLGRALYGAMTVSSTKPVSLRLIPYYTFANREPSAMQVWIPYVRTEAGSRA
jgi:DUF1680 family protein